MVALIRGYGKSGDIRDRFALFLRSAGRSPATERAYLSAVDRYARFAGTYDLDDATVQRYVATRRSQVAQSSLNIELSALKAWSGWLQLALPADWKPVQIPRHKRPPPRVVRSLTDAEVGMLLAAPDLATYVGLRDHVIMATIYQCGLRASEVASLELGSILPDGQLIVRGKGAKERLVPFGDAWRGLVDTYIRQRAALRPGKKAALFLTREGRPLRNGRAIWVIVTRYARRALGALLRLHPTGKGSDRASVAGPLPGQTDGRPDRRAMPRCRAGVPRTRRLILYVGRVTA